MTCGIAGRLFFVRRINPKTVSPEVHPSIDRQAPGSTGLRKVYFDRIAMVCMTSSRQIRKDDQREGEFVWKAPGMNFDA